MNCKRAQTEIALLAGGDLDEASCRALHQHLNRCSECRDYQFQMEELMDLVDESPAKDEADEASKSAVTESLWPSLSSRLVSLPCVKADRFNGWIPAVAVALICLAMFMVASPERAFPTTPVHGSQASADASFLGDEETEPRGMLPSAARPPIRNTLIEDRQIQVLSRRQEESQARIEAARRALEKQMQILEELQRRSQLEMQPPTLFIFE